MKRGLIKDFFNVPNMLTLLRIVILPFFVVFYLRTQYILATASLVVSGCTDTLDGTIARKFNSVTEIGKVLDPFADKLTQLAIAVVISIRFPFVAPMLTILVIKEITMIAFSYKLLKMGAAPIAALWWGKLSTAVFYVTTCIIVAFGHYIICFNYGYIVLLVLTGITTVLMVFAFVKYIPVFFDAYKEIKSKKNKK